MTTLNLPEPMLAGEKIVIMAMRSFADCESVFGRVLGVPTKCGDMIGPPEVISSFWPVRPCGADDYPIGVGLTEGPVVKEQLVWAMIRGPVGIKTGVEQAAAKALVDRMTREIET